MDTSTRQQLDFCLLIPCYNNAEGLVASLKTVQYVPNQFLVVVVDDGSTDVISEGGIRKEIGEDFPLKLLRSSDNEGITGALNKGLTWITANVQAKYIARLDCGDLCHAERFLLQVQYLDNHPEIGLLGSWCRFIDEKTSREYSYKTYTDRRPIIKEMHFRNVFMHATVMFRTALLEKVGYYPLGFEYAEDYAFFWRMIQVNRSVVLNKTLVICRLNRTGLSFKNKNKQLKARWKVVKHFSDRPLLRKLAFIRLAMLFVLPKGLILRLKRLKG